ncbi:MAG: glycosyltransferase [Betaproteobacteria bacterium]|nr:glycosyltransferase [Betaproteobacteria bacterium]
MMLAQPPRIDIVVDARGRVDRVRRCVESIRAHTQGGYRLLLVDAPPDDRARDGTDAHGGRDPGFAAAANHALAGSDADVVLVDGCMVATPGWLEALARCAASDWRIATVMPFSNAAGVGSFPSFWCEHPWPDDRDPGATLAALAAAAVPTHPDPPVGTGPCLYVRRQALDALGGFDPGFVTLAGTQDDFCMRALRAHWRNTLADDAFVVRTDAGAPSQAAQRDQVTLALRHPYFADVIRAFAAADPLRPLREAALSRMLVAGPAPGVLHVIHDHGGGVERHVRALIDASRAQWRHCVATAVGDSWHIDEYPDDGPLRRFRFVRGESESWRDFIGGIAASFRISLIHVHHLRRSREGVVAALPSLGLPWGITIHDLWLACPTVTLARADGSYCGGVTDTKLCARCLDAQPAYAGTDIGRWRREHAVLVAGAAFLIAPSQWAAAMFARYFPDPASRVRIVAHATPGAMAPPSAAPDRPLRAVLLPMDDVPTVAIVGAIGRDKGARRVERLAQRARERGARLRFVVIGYLDVQHEPWQSEDALLTVHGGYLAPELPALFAHYRVALVLYPSEGPESFSYTLSEAWAAGLPALVPPIGALAERVAQAEAGWVMTDDQWRDDDRMLDRIVELVAEGFAPERQRAAARARAADRSIGVASVDATMRIYAGALAGAGAGATAVPAAFPPSRLRDALGWSVWEPPLIEDTQVATVTDAPRVADGAAEPANDAPPPRRSRLLSVVARRAVSIRRTMLGRCLYRVTPASVIDALKSAWRHEQ